MHKSQLTLEKIEVLLDYFNQGIFFVEEGLFTYVNSVFAELVGREVTDLINQPFLPCVCEEDRAWVKEYYLKRLQGEKVPSQYELRLINQDGELIDVRIHVGLYIDEKGKKTSIGTIEDIRESKKTMNDLARSRSDIESILENMPDVFYRTDMQGIITLMSPSAKDAIGYEPEDMVGKPMADFYCTPSDREKVLASLQEGKGRACHVEACLKHKDGSNRWIMTNAYIRMDNEGNPIGVEGIARDITERKAMEDRLLRFARYDDLTQVLNRRSYYQEAEKQIIIAHRYARPASVLMMDLDFFKNINDKFGHHTGDEALKEFVAICEHTIRKADFIGRMGGEEFAVFLPETGEDDAVSLAERIRKSCSTAHPEIDGESVSFTVSIGVALLSEENDTIDSLLSCADKALYQAKADGRNCVRVFTQEEKQ